MGRFLGMGGNNVEIGIVARDEASGVFGSVARSLEHAFGTFVGGAVLNGIQMVGDAVGNLASQAISAASNFQGLQIRLEGLMARELANQYNLANTITETTSLISTLTDQQKADLADLQFEYEGLQLAVEKAAVSYDKMAEKHGAESLEARAAAYNLEKAKLRAEELSAVITELAGAEGQLVTVTRQVAGDTRNAGQMLEEAKEPARALLQWIKQLAVTTPFTVESLSNTLSMSMALGFTSEEAKKMTVSIGNFTAGMGLTEEHLQRIIYNFGQMKTAGKLTGREIRDLTNSLVPVQDILQIVADKFGVTKDAARDMLTEGAIPIQEFFDAFVAFTERDFDGAMERMGGTLTTVLSNVKDFIGSIIGGELLLPLITTFSTRVSALLANLMKPETTAKFTSLGIVLNELFKRLIDASGRFGDAILRLGGAILKALGIDFSQFNFFDFIWDVFNGLVDLIDEGVKFVDWLATLPQKIKEGADGFLQLEGVQSFLADLKTAMENLALWWATSGPGFMTALGNLASALGGLAVFAASEALKAIGAALKGLSESLVENGPKINENLQKLADWINTNQGAITAFALGFTSVGVAAWFLNGALGVLVSLFAILLAPITILALAVGALFAVFYWLGDSFIKAEGASRTFSETLWTGLILALMYLSLQAQAVIDFFRRGLVAGLQLLTLSAAMVVIPILIVANALQELLFLAQAGWLLFTTWIRLQAEKVRVWFQGFLQLWRADILGDQERWSSIGKALVDGLLRGVQAAWVGFKEWVLAAAAGIAAALRLKWDIQSPSRLFSQIGAYAVEGLELGMSEQLGKMMSSSGVVSQLGTVPGMVAGRVDTRSYSETVNYGGVTINDTATGRRFQARQRRRDLGDRERLMG